MEGPAEAGTEGAWPLPPAGPEGARPLPPQVPRVPGTCRPGYRGCPAPAALPLAGRGFAASPGRSDPWGRVTVLRLSSQGGGRRPSCAASTRAPWTFVPGQSDWNAVVTASPRPGHRAGRPSGRGSPSSARFSAAVSLPSSSSVQTGRGRPRTVGVKRPRRCGVYAHTCAPSSLTFPSFSRTRATRQVESRRRRGVARAREPRRRASRAERAVE